MENKTKMQLLKNKCNRTEHSGKQILKGG